jgi:hypothetical protein
MAIKTKKITVEGLWLQYRDACYPPGKTKIEPIQETETRQAFFAGCLIAAKILVESSVNLTEEQACRNIQTFLDEAQAVCRERIFEMKGRN